MSSRKAIMIPCCIRAMNSQRIIAPRMTVMKLKVACPKEPRYLLMKPHWITSMTSHRKMLTRRVGLLLKRKSWRMKMAEILEMLIYPSLRRRGSLATAMKRSSRSFFPCAPPQAFRVAAQKDPSVGQEEDAVADCFDLVHIVRSPEYPCMYPCGVCFYLLSYEEGDARVEGCGGLVEEQEAGLVDYGLGKVEAAELPR